MKINGASLFCYGAFICGIFVDRTPFMAMNTGEWLVLSQGTTWMPCDSASAALLDEFVAKRR